MSETTEHIARKIKENREASGITQTKLAAALGVAANTISRWESGEYKPKISDLEKLARTLKVSIRSFLPGDTKPNNNLQQALLSATDDLTAQDITELVLYADFVRTRKALRQNR